MFKIYYKLFKVIHTFPFRQIRFSKYLFGLSNTIVLVISIDLKLRITNKHK